MTTRDRIRIND